MHPVPSPALFSLDTKCTEAVDDQVADAATHAIIFTHSPPRPVMRQSRSADQVSRHLLSPLDLSDQQQAGSVTPSSLHSATTQGELGLMRHLIRSGASVNVVDSQGYTPLMEAADTGQLDATALLLKKGADPTITNSYGTQALHIAAYKGHSGIVEKLIQSGQSVNQADYFGNTPLIDALKSHDAASVKALLRAGANPNVAAQRGLTALMLGVALGDNELLDLLLQNPHLKNIDAVDTEGRTALNLAVKNGNPAATERLLIAGAAVDHTCWSLISETVISDLMVHRHSLFQPDFTADLEPDHVLHTAPIACIKKIATLLTGSDPMQQAALKNVLHGLGLSGFIVEAILSMTPDARELARALAGEGNKPTVAQWSAMCVSMMQVALSDPALQRLCDEQGLSPVTAERMNALIGVQTRALQAAAHLTNQDMAETFKSSFIKECLYLILKDGRLSGSQAYALLVNQGLHHDLATRLAQITVAAWDRVKKMDKPIQVGYVFPGNFLTQAMEVMEQLLDNEMRALLKLEFRRSDHMDRIGSLGTTELAPAAKAMLMHRHQADFDLFMEAFGLH